MECQEGREGLWTGRFKQRKDKQHTAPHKMPRGKTLHHGRVKTQTRTPREEHQRKKHTSCVQNSIQKDSPRSTKEHPWKKVAAALPFLTWRLGMFPLPVLRHMYRTLEGMIPPLLFKGHFLSNRFFSALPTKRTPLAADRWNKGMSQHVTTCHNLKACLQSLFWMPHRWTGLGRQALGTEG